MPRETSSEMMRSMVKKINQAEEKESVEGKVEKKEEPIFSDSIINEARVLEQILEIEYGFLESEDEVTEYVQARLDYLFPEHALKARIADNEMTPNAMSMPNGVIIVTKGLLDLLETQDELDFVLCHEGIHYTQSHTREIQDVIQEAKDRYQTPGDVVTTGARLLGTMRFAEYEADIRGVIQMNKGKINPAAARSLFQKLEEYRANNKKGGYSVSHGTNISRMINIGSMAALFDSAVTVQDQILLPGEIKEYTETPSDGWLFDEVRGAQRVTDVDKFVRVSEPNEILLALRRSKIAYVEVENDITRRMEKENYERFHKITPKIIAEKIREKLPEYTEKQQDVAIHCALAMTAGITNTEGIESKFGQLMNSLDELEGKEELEELLAITTPEVFKKLSIIIPSFGDVKPYIGQLLQVVNENELFVQEDGKFDIDEYVEFANKIAQHFSKLTTECGFEPIALGSLTEDVVREGLLNLDLRKANGPLFALIQGLREGGIPLEVETTLRLIQEFPHTHQTDDELARIEEELLKGDPFLTAWRNIQKKLLNFSEKGVGKIGRRMHDVESKATKAKYSTKVDAQIEDLPDIKNIGELKSFFEWLFKYTRTHFTENAKMKLVPGTIEDLVGEWAISLIENGAPFLPDNEEERLLGLFACLQSSKDSRMREVLETLLFEGVGYKLDDLSTGVDGGLSFLLDIGKILTGEHKIFHELEIKPGPFSPVRMHRLGSKNIDNQVLSLIAQKCYDNIYLELDKNPPKERLSYVLEEIFNFFFKYIDELPLSTEGDLLGTIFEKYEFDLHNQKDQEILLYLATLFSDPNLRSRLQEAIISDRLKSTTLGFDEKLKLLFEDSRTKLSVTKKASEKFIEHDIQAHNEFAKTEDALVGYMELYANPERIGSLVMVESLERALTIAFPGRKKRDLFRICMETGQNDRELKYMMFHFARIVGDFRTQGGNEDPLDTASAMLTADTLTKSYTTMNDVHRLALVRELLVGDRGLLLSSADRKWLFDYLYDEYIEHSEQHDSSALDSTLREVLGTTMLEGDIDIIFFALAPLIHERILAKPKHESTWEEVHGDGMGKKGYKNSVAQYLFLKGDSKEETFNGKTREQILTTQQLPQTQRVGEQVEKILAQAEQELIPIQERLTVEGFAVKLAESFGAPGIRFVQLLGQYTEVSDKLHELFRDAYDSVKKQSKLTSVHTVRREWPTFEKDVKRVIERRGGGSLMSAYQCEMQDGTEKIVKVLNANTLMFVKETMKVLRKVFDILVKRNRGKYEVMLLALDEIEEWIIEDIQYDTFLENDAIFRDAHHAQTVENHAYHLYVPESRAITTEGNDNMYVKVEEFIQGKTLVRSEELAEHDLKHVASLITKNYFKQVLEPVKNTPDSDSDEKNISLVHADVHPGNFMVFEKENQKFVGIIDRNNFIELDYKDRTLFINLLRQNPEQIAEKMCAYLRDSAQVDIPESVERDIKEEIKAITSVEKEVSKKIPDIMLAFKKRKIRMPLKLTLVVKNLNGLDQLAKQAGFKGGILEAYTYRPKP